MYYNKLKLIHILIFVVLLGGLFGIEVTTLTNSSEVGWVYDLDIDNSGNLYIAQSENPPYKIHVFDANNNYERSEINIAEHFGRSGLEAGMDGILYVGSNNKIHRFDINNNYTALEPIIHNNLGYVYDVVLSNDSSILYAVNKNAKSIVTVSLNNGEVSTLVQSDTFFNDMGRIVIDELGNLFLTDIGNHTVLKVTPEGVISTIAGLKGSSGSINGNGVDARFSDPDGIGIDSDGTIYIGDAGNKTIRKITIDGEVSLYAGQVGVNGSSDSSDPLQATFSTIRGVTIDSYGNVLVNDGNRVIRNIGCTIDDCGVCGGDSSTCSDCAGVPNGDAQLDFCGVCDLDSSNDCVVDYANGINVPSGLNEMNAIPISNAADLAHLSETTADYGKYFIQTANIDLSSYSNWDPIGIAWDGTDEYPFIGTYDGQEYVISNLTIIDGGAYKGLFGDASMQGTLKNMSVTNVNMSVSNYSGALAGVVWKGTLMNCHSSGSIIGTRGSLGGLAGQLYGVGASASRCSSSCTVTGTDNSESYYIGGLFGVARVDISNSFATGDVTAGAGMVGGLVGATMYTNDTPMTISSSYSTGDVSIPGDYEDLAGGFIGFVQNTGTTIINCFATGNVSNTGFYDNDTGGFIGDGKATIIECFATGNVTVNGPYGGSFAGVLQTGGSTENCYATGNLTNTNTNYNSTYGGGFIGGCVGCTSSTSYYSGEIFATSENNRLHGFTYDWNMNETKVVWNSAHTYNSGFGAPEGNSFDGSALSISEMGDLNHNAFSTWDQAVWGWDFNYNNGLPYLLAFNNNDDNWVWNPGTGNPTIPVPPAPPTFTSNPLIDAISGSEYAYSITTLDVNNDEVSVVAITLPDWLAFSNLILSGTPSNSDVGEYSVVLSASDGNAGTVEQSFTIIVTNPNDAPIIEDILLTTNEDTPVSFTLIGTDADEDILVYSVESQPLGGAVSGNTYTPNQDFFGTDQFTYIANDGEFNSNVATVTVTVNPVNDAPEFTSSPIISVDEDLLYSYTIETNDVDGDAVTVEAISIPNWLNLSPIVEYSNTITVQNETGALNFPHEICITSDGVLYTTTQQYNGNSNQIVRFFKDSNGIYSNLPESVINFTGWSFDMDINNNIFGVEYNGDIKKWVPDENGDYTNSPELLATKTDGDGYNWSAGITLDSNGNIYFTDRNNNKLLKLEKSGDSYDLPIIISSELSSPYGLDIDNNGNIWVADHGNGQLTSFSPNGIKLNSLGPVKHPYRLKASNDGSIFTIDCDNDWNISTPEYVKQFKPDGSLVELYLSPHVQMMGIAKAENGTIYFNEYLSGSEARLNSIDPVPVGYALSGTPFNDDNGDHSISLSASDGYGETISQDFIISVNAVNDSPESADLSLSTDEDVSVSFAVYGFDEEGATLNYIVDKEVSNGLISGSFPNITYSPNAEWFGIDTLQYHTNDGNSDSPIASVIITVIQDAFEPPIVSQCPNFQPVIIQEIIANDVTFDVGIDEIGIFDGEQCVGSAVITGETGQVVNTYTGCIDENGFMDGNPISIHLYDVESGNIYSNIVVEFVEFENWSTTGLFNENEVVGVSLRLNTSPVFTSSPLLSFDEDTDYTYNFTIDDAELGHGDNYSLELLESPDWLTLVDNGDKTGSLSGTPPLNLFGEFPIVIEVSDYYNAETTQGFPLTVNSINDVPLFISEPELSVLEDSLFHYIIETEDIENDALTFGTIDLPSWLSLNSTNADSVYLSGVPLNEHSGVIYSIMITINDGNGGTNLQTFDLDAIAVNDPPIVSDIPDEMVLYPTLSFTQIYLDEYVADQETPDINMTWTTENNGELTVTILNQIATIIAPEYWFGSQTITFTSTDDTEGEELSDSDDVTFSRYIEHTYDLNAGWDWRAFSIIPFDETSASSFFSEISDNLVITKSQDEFYLPSQEGESFVMDNGSGYMMQMENSATLSVTGGKRIDPIEPVVLNEGWSWVGYYGTGTNDAMVAFNDVSQHLTVVKSHGGVLLYDSPFGDINTIGTVEVDDGYLVNTTSDTSLVWPDATQYMARENELITQLESEYYKYNKTQSFEPVLISIENLEEYPIENGSEIGLIVNDICIGAVQYNGYDLLTVQAWGSNSMVGQSIKFKIHNVMGEMELSSGYEIIKYDGWDQTGLYNSNNVMAISLNASVFQELYIPDNFALHQNYPNPFNPVTHIKYDLPEATKVNIMVYDINGRMIKRLIDQNMEAGYHSITWNSLNDNGISVPSGIYFYQILLDNKLHSSRKMLLIK